jgi:hypothetical protein
MTVRKFLGLLFTFLLKYSSASIKSSSQNLLGMEEVALREGSGSQRR